MRIITVFDSAGLDTGIWHKGDDDADLMLRAQRSITDVKESRCTLSNGVILFPPGARLPRWTYTISEC